MVTVKLFYDNLGNIIEVEASGHAGHTFAGENIVCASISSIMQTAALGLLMVVNIDISLKRNDEQGYLHLTIPKELSDEKMHDSQIILNTMVCGLSDIYQEYSDLLELEVIK